MTTPDGTAGRELALALTGITKRFGQTVAVDGVSLTVPRGTVHALVGENGAGKTTLMRVAFGLLAPDAGTVSLPGASGPIRSAADAIAAGLGMVHQHFTNVPAMTVAENVALGGHGRFSAAAARKRVVEIGERTGLLLDPDAVVGELPVGAQQRLEIVKALARDARTLILDEPTAVLAPREAEDVLRWLRAFADGGSAVVLVTHKLREALGVADDITVLRHGRVVLASPAASLNADALARALLGEGEETTRHDETANREHIASTSDAVVRLHGARIDGDRGIPAIHDASISVRAGEIVGIAAIEGSGQRELLRALAGRRPVSGGTIRLPRSIGFVPEDRHRDALVLDFSITRNVALKDSGRRRGTMRWRALRERSETLIRHLDIRGGGADTAVRLLSGGNQQKLILARELDGNPELVVAENPTRGLDIRATAAVHEQLRAAARAGAAVVVYASDLDEVLSLADRIVVVHAGRLAECPKDRDAVGRAMLGVA